MYLAVPILAFAACAGLVLFIGYERTFEATATRAAERVIGPARANKRGGRASILPGRSSPGETRELAVRLRTAGLDWTPRRFWTVAATVPLALGGGVFAATANPVFGILSAIAFALATPRIALAYLERRRVTLFNQRLASALDVLIRGAKAGLPLNDCVRLVAAEAPDPIATEFRTILQDQAVGRTLAEAFRLMADRLNTAEAYLLSTVVQIQSQTGGNIAEILTSFSNSLRARIALKDKIKTITAESRYSAYVLAVLPFLAFKMVDSAFPEKTRLLFETDIGNLVLIGICAWMAIGIAIIFKLVNMKV